VASYASQHKKGLPIDKSLRQAGTLLVFCFLRPLLRGRDIPLISSYIKKELLLLLNLYSLKSGSLGSLFFPKLIIKEIKLILHKGFRISVGFSPLFILYKHPDFRLFYRIGRFFVYSYTSVNSLGRLSIKEAYLP
jgi:hypothetical protein